MPRRPGLNQSWNGSAWSVVTTLQRHRVDRNLISVRC
jgi:hypothetical protein